MSQTHKQKIAALLVVTLILCDLISGSPAHLQARQKNNQTEWSEEPTPEPIVEPTAEPTEEPEPTAAPQPNETPKPVKKYELVSPHAKYYKNIETSEAFEVVSPTQGRGNDWVLIAR